ncbi:MAG: flagellar transcriptional regulator FlhD [Roseateles sp.]
MTTEQILAEIRETNLSYLMLAQSLIRADREQALYRLGISEDTATLIASLSPAQILKIATGNTLLCGLRVADDLVWGLITSHRRPGLGPDHQPRQNRGRRQRQLSACRHPDGRTASLRLTCLWAVSAALAPT